MVRGTVETLLVRGTVETLLVRGSVETLLGRGTLGQWTDTIGKRVGQWRHYW